MCVDIIGNRPPEPRLEIPGEQLRRRQAGIVRNRIDGAVPAQDLSLLSRPCRKAGIAPVKPQLIKQLMHGLVRGCGPPGPDACLVVDEAGEGRGVEIVLAAPPIEVRAAIESEAGANAIGSGAARLLAGVEP